MTEPHQMMVHVEMTVTVSDPQESVGRLVLCLLTRTEVEQVPEIGSRLTLFGHQIPFYVVEFASHPLRPASVTFRSDFYTPIPRLTLNDVVGWLSGDHRWAFVRFQAEHGRPEDSEARRAASRLSDRMRSMLVEANQKG
tara:strand:+ start:4788 stop:5204 length:417 start_codon:yes stop_codon:yes gene_type:complete